MFKRFMLPALVAVVALTAVALSPRDARADPRDFTLVNGSGLVIIQVFVAPSSSNDWGDDILGSSVLGPGESVLITFQRFDGTTCYYDIRVIDDHGEAHEEYQFDLCSLDTVTFS